MIRQLTVIRRRQIHQRHDRNEAPDSTAVWGALWRALHVLADAPPHVIEDGIGPRLAAPGDDWCRRPDMDPRATSGFRAAIVSRARFVEDLVAERTGLGVTQYAVLGAGLDTFAQRIPETADRLCIFEIDQPGTQDWKRRRLTELGHGIPDRLRLVPAELLHDADRSALEATKPRAQATGTPFISFCTPRETLALARDAGIKDVRHVPGTAPADRYFADRTDGLRPSSGEDFLVAIT